VNVSLQEALDGVIETAALAYARKWRLVADDGAVWCATDRCERLALLPSLHCGSCLGAHYARKHITSPWCLNRRQACDPNAPKPQEVA
jgi:hypothetical protein